MSQTYFEDESFVLCRQPQGGYITVPENAQHHPLLLRLHGDDTSAVSRELDQPESDLIELVLEIAPGMGIEASIDGKTAAGDTRFVLRDQRRLEREGAIDLQAAFAGAGYPLAAQLLRDGRVILPWTADDDALLRVSGSSDGIAQDARVQEAVDALKALFPAPQETFCCLQDLLARSDAETPHDFGRDLYKATSCGPWVSFVVPGHGCRSSVYYESTEAREVQPAWWSQCTGIDIGSIVEGSDVEVGPTRLHWPFTQAQLYEALKQVDAEASFYWERDNTTFFEVTDSGKSWRVYARWGNFDDAPVVDDFEGEIEFEQALQSATIAGAWLKAHPVPDYETWLTVADADLQVREIPAPSC